VRLLGIVLIFTCVLTGGLQGQAAEHANDETAIRKIVSTYVEAREQRDAKRLASILAPDADQLVSSGEWRKGRDELVRGMLASSERNSGTRTIEIETVRFITADVAIANGRYEIAGAQAGQTRRMWTTFVVARNKGEWRIEAIRNMLPAPARTF
jgi:uncharacterized protein (TIGR02246 family)